MNRPELHFDILPELIRRSLPADYAERAADELADHHRDLIDELQATGLSESQASTEASRRLGDSRTLVKNTVRAYQRRYWCARWPLITFLIAPLPTLLAAWFVVSWCLYSATGLHVRSSGVETSGPDAAHQFALFWMKYASLISIFVAVPAIVTYLFSKLAKRAAVGWPWVVAVGCIMGLAAGTFQIDRAGPDTKFVAYDGPDSRVTLRQPTFFIRNPMLESVIGRSYPVSHWYARNLLQTCQLLLPIAIASIFILRQRSLALCAQRLVVDGS